MLVADRADNDGNEEHAPNLELRFLLDCFVQCCKATCLYERGKISVEPFFDANQSGGAVPHPWQKAQYEMRSFRSSGAAERRLDARRWEQQRRPAEGTRHDLCVSDSTGGFQRVPTAHAHRKRCHIAISSRRACTRCEQPCSYSNDQRRCSGRAKRDSRRAWQRRRAGSSLLRMRRLLLSCSLDSAPPANLALFSRVGRRGATPRSAHPHTLARMAVERYGRSSLHHHARYPYSRHPNHPRASESAAHPYHRLARSIFKGPATVSDLERLTSFFGMLRFNPNSTSSIWRAAMFI